MSVRSAASCLAVCLVLGAACGSTTPAGTGGGGGSSSGGGNTGGGSAAGGGSTGGGSNTGGGAQVATRLSFSTQPPMVSIGQAFSVTVSVQDAQGGLVTTATPTISLAPGVNPGSATIGGTTSLMATAGSVTFSGLTLDHAGVGATLIASSTGLTSAESAPFDVTECAPGATQSCYSGPMGTKGVGPCVGGMQTCTQAGAWGPCTGEVVPAPEVCANSIDDDCNGAVDDVTDDDGDGWTRCDNDCCETASQCASPQSVNPGAFEVPGNGVDDDCDPSTTDTATVSCGATSSKFTSVTATDLAQAMELCQSTVSNPPLAQKKWGLISAKLLFANGATPTGTDLSNLQNSQTAALAKFGTVVVPTAGTAMAGLSTGKMRGSADPGWVLPIPGTTFTSSIAFPGAGPLSSYLAAHGSSLPAGKCASSTCPTGTGANDSAMLELTVRVPTNAHSFSYDLRYFSSEYQSFQCTAFNDYFLALLTSQATGLPADRNISVDSMGGAITVNNEYFQTCGGNSKSCRVCTSTTASIAGTGYDTVSGGATSWLTTSAPVVPGEVITLDFMIFDVNDHVYDTAVLLDNFRWSTTTTMVNTHP